MKTAEPGAEALPLPAARRLVWLATALAGAIRLAHVAVLAVSTVPRWQLVEQESDYAFVWRWSAAIRAGDWLSASVLPNYVGWMRRAAPWEDWLRWYHGGTGFPQAPLYAYLVAVIGRPPEGTPVWVFLFQAAVSTAVVPLVFQLGRRWGGQVAGISAAFLYALCQVSIALDGLMLRDSLAMCLGIIALALLEQIRDAPRPGLRAAAAGVVLALDALERENLLLLGVLAIPLAAWVHAQRAAGSTPRDRLRTAGALGLAWCVALGPLVARKPFPRGLAAVSGAKRARDHLDGALR